MTANDTPPRLSIGIDAHAIGEHATGNERFIKNVAREMREICDHELVLFFTSPEAAAAWPADERTRVSVVRPAHPLMRVPFAMPRAVRHERLDVLLVQYAAPRSPGCPVVSVVHDVSFVEHREWFTPLERLWMPREIPATMRRADTVVTVSEFSKGEIERLYGVRGVVVAPDAPDLELARPRPRPRDLSEPYFLFVGTGRRKGLQTVLEAMRTQDGGPRLVVAGRPDRLSRDERAAAERLPVTFCGYVSDDRLAELLQHAVALLFPSAYEGFGLPVVEAMAAGTPALVSDIPVMREVAGNAARRLPVGDARAWAAEMQSINDDPGLRADLVKRGRTRAAEFSWTTSARTILRTLERVSRPSA